MTTDTPARDPAVPLDLWAARETDAELWPDIVQASIRSGCNDAGLGHTRRAVRLALAVRDSEHAAQDVKVAGLVVIGSNGEDT